MATFFADPIAKRLSAARESEIKFIDLDVNLGTRALCLIWLSIAVSGDAGAQSGTYSSIIEYSLQSSGGGAAQITSGPDGALWMTQGSSIGRISTAGVVTEYPVPNPSSGPNWITSGPDGALWFTEQHADQIGRITTAGVITEYPTHCASPGFTCEPAGITTGPDGALWFTESSGSEIGRITTGGLVTLFPIPGQGLLPVGITSGSDGALWFTNAGSGVGGNSIGRITTTGVFTLYPLPNPASSPWGIIAGSDGDLWFTEKSRIAGRVGKITPAGVITEYTVPTVASSPAGIALGFDGAVWFTEASYNKIGRITASGLITEFPVPASSSASFDDVIGISNGPDLGLWFTVSDTMLVGRAPECALGFSASYTGSTLSMSFDLGVDTPANFEVLLTTSAGTSKPISRQIPAVAPPHPFTISFPNFKNHGQVKVEPVISSASGQALCAEWTTVNTAN
jgi:virginiamycin B lyase